MGTQITHVIFDMDGLLIDTERIYTEVSERLLAPFGLEFCWECKSAQMGRPKREAAQVLIDYYSLEMSVDEYIERVEKLQAELMPTAQMLPGAERFVRHLHKHNIPMCVATGSSRPFFDIKTQAHTDIFRLFHHIFCSDDPQLKRGKPHPDIFELAASRFSPPPTCMAAALVLEDAPNGVEAALAAGSPVLMVPDARVPPETRAKATFALDSLELLRPEALGLPPYED